MSADVEPLPGGCVRTWTSVGVPYTGTPQMRARVRAAIQDLRWSPVTRKYPACHGLAIRALVEEFRIPRVSLASWSNDLPPYGLVAVEGHYRNGRARVYALDLGNRITVLASDFWEARP